MEYIIISLLWIAYCVQHSLLISIRFTGWLKRILKKYYAFYRLFYVIISILLLIPVIRYSVGNNQMVLIHYGPLCNGIRIVVALASLIMFVWAFIVNYDSLTFFGIRQLLSVKKDDEKIAAPVLKKEGLLGLVRHPMYFSLLILLWCHFYTLTDLIVNTILTVYILIGSRLEENKLIKEFGDAYRDYQKEVPMIIPFSNRATFRAKGHLS